MQDETVRSGSGVEMAKSMWARRKWLAILVFTVPFVTGLSVITFMPSLYRSTATVLVERDRVSEAFVRSSITAELETRLSTISQELLSRSRLEALIVAGHEKYPLAPRCTQRFDHGESKPAVDGIVQDAHLRMPRGAGRGQPARDELRGGQVVLHGRASEQPL